MKTLLPLLLAPVLAHAATTIDSTNAHAYGANIGWINCRGDVTNGASIGEYVASGYIYAANVGWIHLGDGTPVNGIAYANSSAADFGVNVTYPSAGVALLRGYAYGANIGWINFEGQGNPRVNLSDGQLLGYAWSANCGWINLNDTLGYVQTTIAPGADTDGDGIADAFEYAHTTPPSLAVMTATSDSDGDGVSDLNEYLEDTNPFDRTDSLRITLFSTTGSGVSSSLTWTSKASRFYRVQKSPDLISAFSTQLNNISPDGATTTRVVGDVTTGKRFFRIQAFRALVP